MHSGRVDTRGVACEQDRRRSVRNRMPIRQHPLTSAVALSLAILAHGAARAEGWTPAPDEVPVNNHDVATFEVTLRGAYAVGLVPPFRAGARDRVAVGLDTRGWIGQHVRIAISEEWLRDETGSGDVVSGLGDLRLGTAVALWTQPSLATGLGWEAKLPNAADAGELGTDETDITLGAWLTIARGDWSGTGAAGLSVLGNPLRFANQDDVPLARLGLAYSPGAFRLGASAQADFETSRNPPRVELNASARYGQRWFVGVAGTAGLVPAAADTSGVLQLGYAWTLPEGRAGE